MPPNQTRKAVAYLTVEKDRYPFDAKVVKSTQSKPSAVHENQIVVKVELQIPNKAFDPLEPQAIVVVPEHLVERGPVEVEAVDPE